MFFFVTQDQAAQAEKDSRIGGSFGRGQFLLESLADLVFTQYFLSFYQHYTQPIYQQHTLYQLNRLKRVEKLHRFKSQSL